MIRDKQGKNLLPSTTEIKESTTKIKETTRGYYAVNTI